MARNRIALTSQAPTHVRNLVTITRDWSIYPCRIQVPDDLSTECLINVKSMCKNLEPTVCHLNLINITYLYNIIFNIVMLVVALEKDNLLLYFYYLLKSQK